MNDDVFVSLDVIDGKIQYFADLEHSQLRDQIDIDSVDPDTVTVADGRVTVCSLDGTAGISFGVKDEAEGLEFKEMIKNCIEFGNNLVDLAMFKEMKDDDACRGGTCSAMQRITQCLNYRSFLEMTFNPQHARMALIDFCDVHYGKENVLRDYVHFMDHHSDPKSVREISGNFKLKCGGVGQCVGTQRHFRERGGSPHDVVDNESTNFYVDTLDALHFYLFHLEEMGLRIPMELLETAAKAVDEEQDDDSLVDAVAKVMAQEIAARRKLLSVDRLDGANNTKFNISTTDKKEETTDGL